MSDEELKALLKEVLSFTKCLDERAKIFSKEVLTIDDIAKLCCVGKSTAGMIFRRIKEKSDRLKIDKIVHLQDYLDAFNITALDRYNFDYNSFKTYIAK